MMKLSDVGGGFVDLKRRIGVLQGEITSMDSAPEEISTIIDTTNLLRTNEYLQKTDVLKDELISCYIQYVERLEGLVGTTLEIQDKLKEILREQNELISDDPVPGRRGSGGAGVRRTTAKRKVTRATRVAGVTRVTKGTRGKKARRTTG